MVKISPSGGGTRPGIVNPNERHIIPTGTTLIGAVAPASRRQRNRQDGGVTPTRHRGVIPGSAACSGERLCLSRRVLPFFFSCYSGEAAPRRSVIAAAATPAYPNPEAAVRRRVAIASHSVRSTIGNPRHAPPTRRARGSDESNNPGHDDIGGVASKERERKPRRRKGRAFPPSRGRSPAREP